jgi:hypothetical protein
MAAPAHAVDVRRRFDVLTIASAIFVIAIVLHGADHIRQGTGSLTREVFWGGAVIAVLGFGTLAMTALHHPRAPLYVAIVGLYTAVGVTASHVLPHWSAFSDSYTNQVNADVISWAAVLFEIGAAFVLGMLGVRELRRRSVNS